MPERFSVVLVIAALSIRWLVARAIQLHRRLVAVGAPGTCDDPERRAAPSQVPGAPPATNRHWSWIAGATSHRIEKAAMTTTTEKRLAMQRFCSARGVSDYTLLQILYMC